MKVNFSSTPKIKSSGYNTDYFLIAISVTLLLSAFFISAKSFNRFLSKKKEHK